MGEKCITGDKEAKDFNSVRTHQKFQINTQVFLHFHIDSALG